MGKTETRIEFFERMLKEVWVSANMKRLYQRQLDKELAEQEAMHAMRREAEDQARERRAAIKAQILSGDVDVVDTVGEEEFGDDYSIYKINDRWQVDSSVARDDQDNHHEYASAHEAETKRRQLIYYRLYNAYVRSNEASSVADIAA